MEVEVLDNSPNNVIVRTEGRRFPGLVVQGDTFHSWISELNGILSLAKSSAQEELVEELEGLIENFEERLAHYEAVLLKNGFEKPYR